MSKIISVLAIWFFNQGSGQEEFDEMLKEIEQQEEEEPLEKPSGEEKNDNSDETAK